MLNKIKSLVGALAIGASALFSQEVNAGVDNVLLSVQDTNGVSSGIEGSVINIGHQIGAHEGYSIKTTDNKPEDTIGPAGPEFSTQQLRLNTLVDGYNLDVDKRLTNSTSTFTAYLSCMDQNFNGGSAFPQLQLNFITRDTNINYEIAIYVPASNTVSGQAFSSNFLLPATGTNIFLPEINIIDASLNGYKTISGDNVGYYGTVNAAPIVVPEPSSGLLVAGGLLALAALRKKNDKKASKLEEKVD